MWKGVIYKGFPYVSATLFFFFTARSIRDTNLLILMRSFIHLLTYKIIAANVIFYWVKICFCYGSLHITKLYLHYSRCRTCILTCSSRYLCLYNIKHYYLSTRLTRRLTKTMKVTAFFIRSLHLPSLPSADLGEINEDARLYALNNMQAEAEVARSYESYLPRNQWPRTGKHSTGCWTDDLRQVANNGWIRKAKDSDVA